MRKIKWKLEKRKLCDLIPYFKNPRQLSKDQEANLRASLDQFGVVEPPCINLDNTIIGGHQRISILKREEIDEIEVMVPSRMLTEKEVEKLNLRLNKNMGEWDWDILANEFEIEDLLDCGFTEKELEFDSVVEDLNSNFDDDDSTKATKDKQCPNCGFIYGEQKTK